MKNAMNLCCIDRLTKLENLVQFKGYLSLLELFEYGQAILSLENEKQTGKSVLQYILCIKLVFIQNDSNSPYHKRYF